MNDGGLQFVSFLSRRDRPTYQKIWDFQKQHLELIASGQASEAIIFCEHERLITKGRRAKDENILDESLPVYDIERGGDVTYHGPGQLVIYPLLRLNGKIFQSGLHEYLRFCEQVVIDLLTEDFHLEAGRFGPTGVWIKQRKSGSTKKIASIGIAVRKWITYHGISLNISNDLSDFQKIRPCNFESSVMTSLAAEDITISLQETADRLKSRFQTKLKNPLYIPAKKTENLLHTNP